MRSLPPFPTLRAFVDWSAAQGQLTTVPDPVSVRHQMTAVHRAVLERGGPVLRFDHPLLDDGSRSDIPVVLNIFGTPERGGGGLGVTLDGLDDLGAFLAALRAPAAPEGDARCPVQMADAQGRDGHPTQDHEKGPGAAPRRHRCRSVPPADPDPLARGCRSADHMADGADPPV